MKGWMASSCVLALTMATAAHAQDNSQDNSVAVSDDATQGGEIVVTANKREQNLRDVPMSVSAIGGDALVQRGATNVADLAKLVPGFTYTVSNYNTPVYFIRGVGFFESSLSADPAVSVYVDQVPLPFSPMTVGATLDLERVEVLKGPQGILFGRNSTGGAVNYIAAKPTQTLEAGLTASYARFGEVILGGHVSGPLTDTLSARFAFKTINSGDWQRSYTRDATHGQKQVAMGRLLLDWKPDEKLSLEFSLSGWRDRSDTQAPQITGFIPRNPALAAQFAYVLNYPLAPADPRAADWNDSTRNPLLDQTLRSNNRQLQGALRGDYELTDDLTLTSLTSYARYWQYNPIDQDGMSLRSLESLDTGNIKSFSQEVRLGLDTRTLKGILGANFQKDGVDQQLVTDVTDSTASITAGIPFRTLGASSTQSIKTYAVFGNLEKTIGDLTVYGGLRYTRSARDYNGCGTDGGDGTFAAVIEQVQRLRKNGSFIPIAPGACNSLNAQLDPAPLIETLKENNVSYRFGASYAATGNVNLYANATRGYKAGGHPTTSAAFNRQLAPVTQERVDAYEAGIKASLFDRLLSIDAAGFYLDYRDKQIRGIIPDPLFGRVVALVNVPKSTVKGAEVSATIRPLSGLQLGLSGTYLDGVVKNGSGLNVFGVEVDLAGKTLPQTPKFQGNADIGYQWNVNDRLGAFVNGNLSYRSRANSQVGNDAPSNISRYALVDLDAGIESTDGRWKVTLFGRNVFNKYYWTSANALIDVVVRYAGQPATYGVRVAVTY